jgi:heme exporter protein C
MKMQALTRYGRPALGMGGLLLLAVGSWLGLSWAPSDRDMGDVQRIMYAHVPAVWAAMLALSANFICSIVFLVKNDPRADSLAEATAEVGVVLGTVGVLLGAIWGKPTWGVWWTWDPRLTTAAVMIVAYLGVMALRSFVDDPERRATWAAVAGIIAFVDLPIVWFSVRWWRSLHQVQSSSKTMDPDMATALQVNTVAVLLIAGYFVWTRYRLAQKRREQELVLPELTASDLKAQQVTP